MLKLSKFIVLLIIKHLQCAEYERNCKLVVTHK